eukprot:CAMPEP_0172311488 /NCGR_PEP_ID=MMETSP1058-20130122/14876_1 /TAXON_ID=83371 /ORGANISM="Detonula confervacea, Strain CCMP 353" /LENGTH=136 /DNA_ID=CAMNT_0013024675 /DNA_START=227 /DNA_END=634 /DNA_ORIENTATION=+
MKVAEYMTTAAQAQTAKPDTSMEDIAKQLTKHNCSCVVIVEEERPVGILTKTDITRAFVEGVSHDTSAKSFMSDKLICVKVRTQTDDIADLIQKKFVHHLVVVDDEGNFSGVASSWDVAREVSLDAKAFPYNRELW